MRISSQSTADYVESFYDTFDAESTPIVEVDEIVLRQNSSDGCAYSLYDISTRSMRSLFDLSLCGPLIANAEFVFAANGNDLLVYDRHRDRACNYVLDTINDLSPASGFNYDKGQIAGLGIIGKWLLVASTSHTRDVVVELSELTSCRL